MKIKAACGLCVLCIFLFSACKPQIQYVYVTVAPSEVPTERPTEIVQMSPTAAPQSQNYVPIPSDVGNFQGNQEMFLVNLLSGRCIDVQGSPGTASGTLLQLYDCEFSNPSSSDQVWKVTDNGYIVNAYSGKCLDVKGLPGVLNGESLTLNDCEFNDPINTDQRWGLTRSGFIVNLLSGRCIDVVGAVGTANSSFLELYDCEYTNESGTDQRWTQSNSQVGANPPAEQNQQPPPSSNKLPASGTVELLPIISQNGYFGMAVHGAGEVIVGKYQNDNVMGLMSFDISGFPDNVVIDSAATQLGGFTIVGENQFIFEQESPKLGLYMYWCRYGEVTNPDSNEIQGTFTRHPVSTLIKFLDLDAMSSVKQGSLLPVAIQDAINGGYPQFQLCLVFLRQLDDLANGYLHLDDLQNVKLIVTYHSQ